jgi:beta-lactamase class A
VKDDQFYTPTENVVDGHTYTVRELIRLMLQQSSNEAVATLVRAESENQFLKTFNDLGLPLPTPVATNWGDYHIGIHDFSSFLRVLYNTTYLTRPDSEELLSVLTKTSYTNGLVAGVPSGVTVAHKFGTSGQTDGSVELPDRGIIYVPQNRTCSVS